MHLLTTKPSNEQKGYRDFELTEESESKSEGDINFKFDNPYANEDEPDPTG